MCFSWRTTLRPAERDRAAVVDLLASAILQLWARGDAEPLAEKPAPSEHRDSPLPHLASGDRDGLDLSESVLVNAGGVDDA
jgi:hypothetical protein